MPAMLRFSTTYLCETSPIIDYDVTMTESWEFAHSVQDVADMQKIKVLSGAKRDIFDSTTSYGFTLGTLTSCCSSSTKRAS
jgi:hypothetical protein